MSHSTLTDLQACHEFVSQASPQQIAAQLRRDKEACRIDGGVPSLLAYSLPQKRQADQIALALAEDDRIPLPIARMLYTDLVSSIKAYLANMERPRESVPDHMVPTDEEFTAALKVLRYLQLPHVSAIKSPCTPLDKVVQTIHAHLRHGEQFRHADVKPLKHKLCYICRYKVRHTHRLYPSLCNPCGEFNISSSALSLPPNLALDGKTALVTGGRINLGYHTALRLLRCGAKVIVSSRYPFDAEQRYLAEADAELWKGRLKIVGADFRSAKDVFALVGTVKRCCHEWKDGSDSPALNILINNAAQTLTDSVEKEAESIRREGEFESRQDGAGLVTGATYQARVRGGYQGYLMASNSSSRLIEGSEEAMVGSELVSNGDSALAVPTIKSSWTQTMSEIPYEDVISAHSVNTFVPFILLRELLPLMGRSKSSTSTSTSSKSSIPSGYIINVSSREGLFEKNPKSTAKNGLHVHTNMSKAALNMLTETEASTAWQKYKVAINSVDPGYMSADPMFMEMLGRDTTTVEGQCPIGWEDGAGRVLWPIAKGEKGEAVWGRFLKHFKEVSVGR
ncbi:dehydrogenase [Coprinopsis cinerea okayama7|uniref:Dehydrogenase n=1 Tax=Coprinopsis cinerea (strain Okayama-7 / 130 / ATCC MYA-4618 / FGSC 9003) TaxID=240176 RepID=A8P9D2_COPC7|nr:dehydrogenase [Coprinopsis cinerea okayama7\|eukprot:XP_001839745.1 dehydrogenase [Coprinopsis cinerea okayama7\